MGNREFICFCCKTPFGRRLCAVLCGADRGACVFGANQGMSGGPKLFHRSGWAMGCRCAERRTALTKALVATARGDSTTATNNLSFVVRSSIEDVARAGSSLRDRMQQARVKLGARR